MNLREKVNAWIESLKGFDLLKGNRWEGMLATFVLSFIWGVCVGISFCVGYQFRNYLLCNVKSAVSESPVFIELWCNGNTSDFGSEILGSSPDSLIIEVCLVL